MSTDQNLVRRLREEVADLLAQQRHDDSTSGIPPMSAEDERQFARALISRVLDQHAREEIAAGRTPMTSQEEEEVAQGIHAALFGVGRLQPLLEDPDVENIDINGYDNVFIQYADGREERGAPVADSDDELVELVQVLGSYSGLVSRPFDSANPQLDLRLPDGSRLSAIMDVCARPALSLRRARLDKVGLDELIGLDTLSPRLAAFCSAAVRARKNIMIAGATNAGKTTFLRALANEIPPSERLITVERALELGLGEFSDLHPNVVAFEERLPNSEGDEIVTMLNAMSQGNDGSLSTIHANSSSEVFNRIATYAIQSHERLPQEATNLLIAGAIDFVIFLTRENRFAQGGTMRRYIASVREVNGVDGRVLSSEVFADDGTGHARPAAPIACVDDLVEAGYDPIASYAAPRGAP